MRTHFWDKKNPYNVVSEDICIKKIIEYCLFVLMVSEDGKKKKKRKEKKIYPVLSGSCFAAIHNKDHWLFSR